MSCIKEGNVRCSKCCEVMHVDGEQWNRYLSGKITLKDQDFIKENFVQISKRRAKKINPYMFDMHNKPQYSYKDMKQFLSKASYLTCKVLVNGVCTKREDRPHICRVYKSGVEYSPTCPTDHKIIARSVD